MNVGENLIYSDILILSLASYLVINSLLIGLRERKSKSILFFATACFSLAIVLLQSVLYIEKLIYEIACLLIWAAFYFSLQYHRRDYKLNWSFILHISFPAIWVIIQLLQALPEVNGIFEFVYLLSTFGYGWACIYEASRLRKVAYWDENYLYVLFIGLIIIISSRFILPVFFQSMEIYTTYYHIILGSYFILLSSFYIKAPIKNFEEQMATVQLNEAINYEEELKRKLKNAMKRDKLFLDPELTLSDLADKLAMKSTALSNFINNNLGKNFNDFVNEYRVEEVKSLMASSTTDPQVTVMELAYDAGFNSKASFNRIFKQFTQMTPTQFKKSIQKADA